MNANKFVGCLALMVLATLLVGTASAQVLPLVIEHVEIDDTDLLPNGTNRLDVERGNTYEVEVKITALADVNEVELEAFISGYEYNDIERVSDTTHSFDADAGVTYVKRLKVHIPDDVEEDDYKLRVILSDRFSDAIIQNYNLKLDVPRHAVRIDDVILFPNSIEAGKALLATVRVENKGEKVQDDVRVTVSIPELGIKAVDYIEELEEEDEEETEEIFLKIPSTAKSGQYTVNVEVHYDELHRVLSEQRTVSITGAQVEEDLDFTVPVEQVIFAATNAQATAGGVATYSFTVTNHDKKARVFTVNTDVDFGQVTVLPAPATIIKGKASQVFTVQVRPNEDVSGTKSFTVNVKQGSEVQSTPVTLQVNKASMSWGQVAKIGLTSLLAVLLVLLVILGLVLAARKMNEDGNTAEAYY